MPQIQLDATLFAAAFGTVLVIMAPLGKLLRPGGGGHGDGEADSTNVALAPLGTPMLAGPGAPVGLALAAVLLVVYLESWVRSGVS